jgi:hypothetical protein
VFGANRPKLIVVEPARAACIHERRGSDHAPPCPAGGPGSRHRRR